MKSNIKCLFIISSATGHINPTISFIRELYQDFNIQSYLFSSKDSEQQLKEQGVNFLESNTHPFGIGREDKIVHNNGLGFLHNLYLRATGKLFIDRKKELSNVIEKVKPNFIFIDYHFSTDYIILQSLGIKEVRKVLLIHSIFYPFHTVGYPSLNSYLLPNNKLKLAFEYYQFIFSKIVKSAFQKIIYLGFDNLSQIKKVLQSSGLEKKIKLNFKKHKFISFDEIENWTLLPLELEFDPKQIPQNYKYLGNYFLKNPEKINQKTCEFITYNRSLNRKIIYVSLGTLHLIHTNNKSVQFFEKIIKISAIRNDYAFIISLGKAKIPEFTVVDNFQDNILMDDYFPQYTMLKEVDLFISHGGSNSILEAINQECPMLVVPLNNKYDQIGNSNRIEFFNLGIAIQFNLNYKLIIENIDSIFTNYDKFKSNLKVKKEEINYKLDKSSLFHFD